MVESERQLINFIRNIMNRVINFKKIVILAILTSLLIACSNPTKKGSVDNSIRELSDSVNIEYPEVIEEHQRSDYLKIVGDSVEIPYFEIELKLSDKAEKKLKTDNESIIVMAYFTYFQEDKIYPEKYKDNVDYSGELMLLSYPIELTDKRLAIFENVKFSKDLYDLFGENKDIDLLINVFSGRKSCEDNILDCTILQNPMSKIKGKRFTIEGKLIYNDD